MYTNRDHYSLGGRNFQKRDFNKPSGPRQMFKAVCSSCGKDCEVPFIPSGNKPVYCSDCFSKQTGGDSRPRFENRNSVSPRPQSNDQLNTIISKLDKVIALLSSSCDDVCCQGEPCGKEEAKEVGKPKVVKEDTKVVSKEKVKAQRKSAKSPKASKK